MNIASTAPFSVLLLILTIGLIARLTRFLVDDSLARPAREWVFRASTPGGDFVTEQSDPITARPNVQAWHERTKTWKNKLAGFAYKVLDCGWCCSVWIAAEVTSVAAYAVHHGGGVLTAYWWVAAAGTASMVYGLVQTWVYSKE